MLIGVPKECKPLEGRVALCPHDVGELTAAGHDVLVQQGAGVASGYEDVAYATAGADLVPGAEALYGGARLIIKVKEPVAADLRHLRADHQLFCFLHLAADPALVRSLCDIGLSACAFETVEDGGRLPLLAPMSAIAGRIAVQAGAHYLQANTGGPGILPGGIPGAPPARVVILGGGVAGTHATAAALGLGAAVTVHDISAPARAALAAAHPGARVLEAGPAAVHESVMRADLLIGAALVPGARAPVVVAEGQVRQMKKGSVIVDIAVDQGGCIATTRATTYEDPVYERHGVRHMAVTNLPGAVPRTASQALSAAVLPYALRLAATGPEALPGGLNVHAGRVVHPAVQAFMEELAKKDTLQ